MSKQPSTPAFRRFTDHTWRGPSARVLAITAVVLILGLSGLLVAGLAGINQGLHDREAEVHAQIQEHYDKGLAYVAEGRTGLATAEFERVLQLDPANAAAQSQLQALAATPTPTLRPTPNPSVPVPLLVPPAGASPTATVDQSLLVSQALFQDAQAAMEEENWSQAEALLAQLEGLDPAYRPDDLLQMRFEAAYRQGLDLVDQERYEEALRAFDQALAIQPDNPEANTERDLVALYSNALGTWRADWGRTVESLLAIYQQQPDFLDVADRLRTARESWGDDLGEDGRWCLAAEQYLAAMALETSTTLEDKQEQADQYCVQPPPEPTTTAVPDVTPTAIGAAPAASRGQIALASFSPDFKRWTVFRLAASAGAEPKPVVDDGSQPALSPDATRLAVRSERGDQTGLAVIDLANGERLRVTTFFEDAHPSWSPDARQLTYESNREGDRRWRIYRTGSRGGEEVSLGFGRWPAWSPRGNVIAYQGCDERGNRCGIWLTAPDGSNRRPVTDVPGDAMPAWSPDGARLAFASAERGGGWDIYVVEVETGNVATLASSPAVDGHPTWSPDGSQVAFLSNRDGAWSIYAVDVASGQARRLLIIPGQVPDWFEMQISWR